MAPLTFVVPLDGSAYAERALPVATAFAKRVDGRILLASIAEHGPLHPGEYLSEIAAYPRGVPIETAPVTDAYPADAITKIAADASDRIVCMTSHGRGGLRWGLVGSVAEDVVRNASRPTLLVGRHCREEGWQDAKELLACVDGSESSTLLAPVAVEWAERLGLDLHIVIVVHPLDIESAEHPDTLLGPIVEQFGGPARAHATTLTRRYVEGAIADYAADLPAALIMMSSHARTGFARVALGSTTMGVLQQAPCPLLVVSPQCTKGSAP
jgi:nucleotide-binding universal stress UspA family protein